MYYVYVLESKKDKRFYIGYTEDLKKRYALHQEGKVMSTKNRLPITLIYYEAYVSSADAKGRELFLKSGSGHRYLRKQLVNYFGNKQ